MNRHQILARLHELARPRTYFEIGVNDGRSLALSRSRTVAVDPAPNVKTEVRCDLHLVTATSDDFFAREAPFEHLGDAPRLDLSFIDGMHLFEYVLRDFINVEKHADWSSVIVLDDQLPRNVDEAARDRHTAAWTGDVFKMIGVLQRYRPDLRLAVLDSSPTGVTVIFGADPSNSVLSDHYDQIMADYLVADPQEVPAEVLTRSCAMSPESLLAAPFWASLRTLNEQGEQPGRPEGEPESAPDARTRLFAEIDKALAGQPRPRLADWKPDERARRVAEFIATAPGEAEIVRRVVSAGRAKGAVPPGPAAQGRPADSATRKLTRAVVATPGVRWFGAGVVRILPRGVRASIRRHVRRARRARVV